MSKKPFWRFWNTKEENEKEHFEAGYSYGAGVLLKGNCIGILEHQIEESKAFGEMDRFDKGIEYAISHWEDLNEKNEFKGICPACANFKECGLENIEKCSTYKLPK